MNARADTEIPLFLGAKREVFGLFHSVSGLARKAVLLCPPLGQDQIRCHRLYRQLAQALAAEGIPVLRFDYYGTGDSAGDSADVDWERCLADTVTAADELRTRSGAVHIIAFGARLGGGIALAAAVKAQFIGVVAWDPVVDGREYVAQLDAMQGELRVDLRRFIKPRLGTDIAAQWLGFAISGCLRQQLIDMTLEAPAVPTLVLDSLDSSLPVRWKNVVPGHATVRPLQPPTPWDDLRRLEVAILSHPLIQAVTNHVREAA
jgi:pimeloyl-ACP methyl ester carboxylesterase